MTKLDSEEFKQMHDHLREHEKAITLLTTVMVTTSVALLSAVGVFYFSLRSTHSNFVTPILSCLLLAPAVLIVPLVASITGHRASLYKIGLYIKVFCECQESGAMWHRRLQGYQASIKGESNDVVPFFAWTIFAISYLFYVCSLAELESVLLSHYVLPLVILIPILVVQHVRHNAIKNISNMEAAWDKVRDEEVLYNQTLAELDQSAPVSHLS
jgi:hypothetical protein